MQCLQQVSYFEINRSQLTDNTLREYESTMLVFFDLMNKFYGNYSQNFKAMLARVIINNSF